MTASTAASEQYPSVINPTERRARGKGLRDTAPRDAHAAWRAPAERADPIGILQAADPNSATGFGTAALWPHAAIPIHILPWVGGRHGGRSGPHAGERHPCPGLRRLPSDEFRGLRHAGAPPHFRHQRPRRDIAGALGVGRQASRRIVCARRPFEWTAPTRTDAMRRSPVRAAIAERCATLPRWTCSTSGTPGSTTATFWRCCRRTGGRC